MSRGYLWCGVNEIEAEVEGREKEIEREACSIVIQRRWIMLCYLVTVRASRWLGLMATSPILIRSSINNL